jgi:hypothetical protein
MYRYNKILYLKGTLKKIKTIFDPFFKDLLNFVKSLILMHIIHVFAIQLWHITSYNLKVYTYFNG